MVDAGRLAALGESGIELECPSCHTDDPAEYRNGCEDPWHAEAVLVLGEESSDG